jgi:hypothetical protein
MPACFISTNVALMSPLLVRPSLRLSARYTLTWAWVSVRHAGLSRIDQWLGTFGGVGWSGLDYRKHISGGEGGIRTRGGLLTLTRFPGVRLKPLIHLSAEPVIVAAGQHN